MGVLYGLKGAIAPINWQYRFKVRTYTHEVLGLLSSNLSSIDGQFRPGMGMEVCISPNSGHFYCF